MLKEQQKKIESEVERIRAEMGKKNAEEKSAVEMEVNVLKERLVVAEQRIYDLKGFVDERNSLREKRELNENRRKDHVCVLELPIDTYPLRLRRLRSGNEKHRSWTNS